ncbi:MAG: 50S ribosomal protein L22 [Anaerolineaceae bacterium]|nr:50S ribosomal protein L22 [Anaerolineaceae bacterium]
MATDVRAKLSNCGVSAQKVRLVTDMVRNMAAVEAMEKLRFVPKEAAKHIRALLNSAIANAEENFGLNKNDLYIYKITADEAPTRRWRRFGARGRFKKILRRSSHITIILRERE